MDAALVLRGSGWISGRRRLAMPDEVLLVVLVVMAIGVGWKWAKNRIDEKKWRETSLTRKFFISLIALLLMVLFWIEAMFIRYLGQSLR